MQEGNPRSMPQSIAADRSRPTIGLLTSQISDSNGQALCLGVVDTALRAGADIVCFVGGELQSNIGFEAQKNILYHLVNSSRLDGLVLWLASLVNFVGSDGLQNFCDRFPLPMTGVGPKPEGIPRVRSADYEGMRMAVAHLIENHGCRQLAFLPGPAGHPEGELRFQAYVDELKSHALDYNPYLVAPHGFWDPSIGREQISILLDQRRVHFDAVVTASDLLALGAMQALQERGVGVPNEVAVVGYDDAIVGRYCTPPLTSVPLLVYEEAQKATEMLLTILEGRSVSEQITLPPRLVLRQSCGCPDPAVAQAAVGDTRHLERPADALGRQQSDILLEMSQAGLDSAFAALLLDAFVTELKSNAQGSFLSALALVLNSVAAQNRDILVWHNAISVLRRYLYATRTEAEIALRAEDVCQQARVMIAERAVRLQVYQQRLAEKQAQTLREISQTLITTLDLAILMDVLAQELPKLEIPSCYLSLYESQQAPEKWSHLMVAYDERGRIELEPEGRRFPSSQLVPDGLMRRDRPRAMIVMPLGFREQQIGFVLFECGPRDTAIYDALSAQISSALKGVLLMREMQQARTAAEKADQIKTRLLANVSHELRTPLNIILGYTNDALGSLNPYGITPPQALLDDLAHIRRSADHQLRVINDLLDLSRAEINELDLYKELLDPRPLLADALQSIMRQFPNAQVAWHLQLPDRLPLIQIDPVRFRQILLNLLSNAAKFTEQGQVVLGAQVEPPHLHIWVHDTGIGIPLHLQEHIFEPFVTSEQAERRPEGIGLGLSITRRLVALHNGSMRLESAPGKGSTFHIDLPLPNLADKSVVNPGTAHPVLLWIATTEAASPEIIQLAEKGELELYRLQAEQELDDLLTDVQPAALAWNLATAQPKDWNVVRRLRNHPRLNQIPFILYGPSQDRATPTASGLTGILPKTSGGKTLLDTINAMCPKEATGPILIVDDDPAACRSYRDLIDQGLTGYRVAIAHSGTMALAAIAEHTPSLVLLDLMMPEMDGFDVLDRIRQDPHTNRVPVIILSNKLLSLDDVKRIERHRHVVMQSKGVLSDEELVASLQRSLFGADALQPQTSALVKRAVAYIHQNYARPLTRWEIAEAIGVSENYLSRVFSQDLGVAPWEYVNRFRISKAKELLNSTDDSVKAIACRVGFKDPKYFTRLFRKLTGVAPNDFREQRDRGSARVSSQQRAI